MEIHEYQAKALLREFGIKTLKGKLAQKAHDAEEIIKNLKSPFWVIKAQVHAGGRGLGGGIKKADSPESAIKAVQDLIGFKLITAQTGKEGKIVHQVLVEEGCNIEKEFYLAFVLDRSAQVFRLIVSSEGGVSIEETAKKSPEKIFTQNLDPLTGLLPFHSLNALKILNLPLSFKKSFHHLLQSLYKILIQKSAQLIEINPLVLTKSGELLPLDAKMSIDDNALFKQPDMQALRDLREIPATERKAVEQGLSFVKLDGNIGCLVNGAGLAMATMDIVQLYGGKPANFLDVGGGVDSEKIDAAFRILKEEPQVKGILVNIFGGIVKCDLIAQGLIKAIKELNIKMPSVVRLEGTNAQQAKKLLKESKLQINFADDFQQAARLIVELTGGKK